MNERIFSKISEANSLMDRYRTTRPQRTETNYLKEVKMQLALLKRRQIEDRRLWVQLSNNIMHLIPMR